MNEKIQQLKNEIERSDNIVFLGGAGVSTESGIPDFRSPKGLYQQHKFDYPAETILSNTFFRTHTEEFYEYYKTCMIYPNAAPNKAHKALATLEKRGKLKGIITQNIDGLHQAAGSKNVYELHGTVLDNYCTKCGEYHPLSHIINSDGIPQCQKCQEIVKPDVVLYEEALNEKVIQASVELIANAEILIIGGTSLTVFPAAALYTYYRGKCLCIINKTSTSADEFADIVIHDSIGDVLEQVL